MLNSIKKNIDFVNKKMAFKSNEYIKFLVYLKSGETVIFYKLLPANEQPTEFMNKITDLLFNAKIDKDVFEIESDNYQENKGRIFEYQSRVVIDGEDISAINSGMINK